MDILCCDNYMYMYYNLIFLDYKSSFFVKTVAMLYLKDEHYIVVKCYFILPVGFKFWCCWFFKNRCHVTVYLFVFNSSTLGNSSPNMPYSEITF